MFLDRNASASRRWPAMTEGNFEYSTPVRFVLYSDVLAVPVVPLRCCTFLHRCHSLLAQGPEYARAVVSTYGRRTRCGESWVSLTLSAYLLREIRANLIWDLTLEPASGREGMGQIVGERLDEAMNSPTRS
jgi:hypothetical protein